jgi:hypothetical protein
MHLEMQVKQHKIVIFPRFRSPDLSENFPLNVERLDQDTMGKSWEGFKGMT